MILYTAGTIYCLVRVERIYWDVEGNIRSIN